MRLRGVILDVDGTVVRGDNSLPGARQGLQRIDDAGLRRLFVSNNPTKAAEAYEARFARAGFDVSAREVLTAGSVTASYLSREHGDGRLYVVGEAGLREILEAAGLELTTDPETATVFVASIDRSFDYDALCRAVRALADPERPFIGTDPDMVIPTADGDIPGSGAIINAIAGPAGRAPDLILGKPSITAREMALSTLGLDADECLVVGDRLDTDIQMGVEAGMTTALVLTGVTDETALKRSSVAPDYILDSMADLDEIL